MTQWWDVVLLAIVGIVSVYLIAKGIEIFLRGTKAANPNRINDLLFASLLLIPGVAAAFFLWFWILPRLQQ